MKMRNAADREIKFTEAPIVMTDKAIKSLADSIFETLKNEGCRNNDIIGVSSQLIGLVTTSIKNQDKL